MATTSTSRLCLVRTSCISTWSLLIWALLNIPIKVLKAPRAGAKNPRKRGAHVLWNPRPDPELKLIPWLMVIGMELGWLNVRFMFRGFGSGFGFLEICMDGSVSTWGRIACDDRSCS